MLEGLLSSIYTLSGYEGVPRSSKSSPAGILAKNAFSGRTPFFHRNGGYGLRSLEIERKVIRELALEDGKFLSFLNSEMDLGQEKIMKSKWGIKKRHSARKNKAKKENASRSIQTFLTDLFPSSSSKETT